MMNLSGVRFGCESLLGANKVGLLQKDSDGYYPMIVGALNVYNSAGAYYEFEESKNLFEQSSQLQRRIKRGVLRGEYGHPRPEPGQSNEEYIHRIMDIDPMKVCCHHREITLDFDNVKDKDGKPVIAIMSKVQPSGPLGEALRASLENKHENVCFSIRAFTDDDRRGPVVRKILRSVVTFDYVIEPGIEHAEKYKSPSLEARVLVDKQFSRGEIERATRVTSTHGAATESIRMSAQELFQAMNWLPTQPAAWTKW